MNWDQVPVTDRGFRYGWGVFETIVVRSGRAEFFSWHVESLEKAALALGLSLPRIPDSEPPGVEGIWRWFHTETGTRTWWETGVEPTPLSMELGRGVVPVHSTAWSARFKTLSYLTQLQNKPKGSDQEVLVVNERNEVVSAAMANVFWVRHGRLETAPHDAGCRCGVVRRWVMEYGGVPVKQARLAWSELDCVEEMFLTNSRLGIVPVRSWPGREQVEFPGPITARLRDRFRADGFF